MSVFHYLHLISMSLDAGRPEFKRQVKKKGKEEKRKTVMVIKLVTPVHVLLMTFFSSLFFSYSAFYDLGQFSAVLLFWHPPLRDLEQGNLNPELLCYHPYFCYLCCTINVIFRISQTASKKREDPGDEVGYEEFAAGLAPIRNREKIWIHNNFLLLLRKKLWHVW